MPISLATHLKLSRCGIYYFRMRVPEALRQAIGKREIIHSLKTRDSAKARRLAYTFASKTYELFEMAYDPTKFNPADLSTFPTADKVKTYKIDLARGILESEGPDDHERMLEALEMMKKIPTPVPVAPAPAQWVEPTPPHTITLTKALVAYLATIQNDKTRSSTARDINRFIECCGDVDIHKVSGVDVVNWNAKLLVGEPDKNRKAQAPRTADNSIQYLQGLLKWAQRKEYIHHSAKIATEGKANLTKKQRTDATKGAESFSTEQLIKIFDPAAYKSYYGDSRSRYWFPLIALHTGMRKEEIAQLTPADIKTERGSGVSYIDINRNWDKKTKTINALRYIPIHDTLIKLGFMDYAHSRRNSPTLFTESGNAVSHAFIRYIEKIEVKDKDDKRRMVFHSFRDTFNNVLATPELLVQDRLRYALMGHSTEGDTNATNYTKKITVKDSKACGVDKLFFEETVAGVTHKLDLLRSSNG